MNNPLVSVCCITYNQEDYIGKCIEGFLMQITDFPIEIIIHDDASTDRTAEIIEEYISKDERVKSILRSTNIKSTGVHVFPIIFKEAKGKYIAPCEGDDYWIDPYKLQKQVDFMEQYPACSLVFTGCEIHKSNGEKKIYNYSLNHLIDADEYLTKAYFITTASLLFRNEVISETPNEAWMNQSFAGDFILLYRALLIGRIGSISDVTCIYNKGTDGSWTKRKLTKKVVLKEYSDNLRGLYYLSKYSNVSITSLLLKRGKMKASVYFKIATTMKKWKGLGYLILNLRKSNYFYLLAYIKRSILNW